MAMAMLKAKPRKSLEDLAALPDETRAELIDGEITVMNAPLPRHGRIVFELGVAIRTHVRGKAAGEVFLAPVDVALPSGDVVEPDLLWLRQDRLEIVRTRIEGAPDLVVEVLSPTSLDRDRHVKKALYARNGVREYWIVDPDARSIEVFALDGERYEPAGYFLPGAAAASVVLAGFAVPVDSIFR